MVFILDKTSKEIGDRPLISGTIFLKKSMDICLCINAWRFYYRILYCIHNFVARSENVTNWGCRGCKLLYEWENRCRVL